MPAPTDDDVQAFLLKAINSPDEVEVDGRKVKPRNAADLISLIEYATYPDAKPSAVIRVAQFASGRSPLD